MVSSMVLALDKHAALYIFFTIKDAERELEAIDVQEDNFEFCDVTGQRFTVTFTIPPKVSGRGPLRSIDIGAFMLTPEGGLDSTLPERFIKRAQHIEHTSIPEITSIEMLRIEMRKRIGETS